MNRLHLAVLALCLAAPVALGDCGPSVGRSTVSMRMARTPETPRDASVTIDEEYIGPLYFVAARGVALPVGKHRITVEKEGYFPWDQVVEADRKPIQLQVKLVKIPD
jgi:hypothetical protein